MDEYVQGLPSYFRGAVRLSESVVGVSKRHHGPGLQQWVPEFGEAVPGAFGCLLRKWHLDEGWNKERIAKTFNIRIQAIDVALRMPLPPVRLHDTRHGAASLGLDAERDVSTEDLLVVLCRPIDSPNSKTRLVADVGDQVARQVYKRCLSLTLSVASRTRSRLRVSVAGDPSELEPICSACAPRAELVRQQGATFAERQRGEIQRGLAEGHRRVAFMVPDLPAVQPRMIEWVLSAADERVRVAPSHDGGYAILGSGVDLPELLSTPMSRSDTMRRLVGSMRSRGKHVEVAESEVPNINHGTDLRCLTER